MVFKTTVSDSQITSFLRFSKQSTRAREICKILVKNGLKNGRKMKISHDVLHSFENRKKLVIRESETVVLNTINPMNSKFCVTRFFRFFHFSGLNFFLGIYREKQSYSPESRDNSYDLASKPFMKSLI